jgi:hypothetical protein
MLASHLGEGGLERLMVGGQCAMQDCPWGQGFSDGASLLAWDPHPNTYLLTVTQLQAPC